MAFQDTTEIVVNGTTIDLAPLVGRFDQLGAAEQELWNSPTSITDVQTGQIAYVYSYGASRRGVVTKVGRTKVTVTFTTEGAMREFHDPRYRNTVKVTAKAEGLGGILIKK